MPPKERPETAWVPSDNGWYWVIIMVPPSGAKTRIYKLGQLADPQDNPILFGTTLTAAYLDAGLASGTLPTDVGWDVSISSGQPHVSMLSRATVIDWSSGIPLIPGG